MISTYHSTIFVFKEIITAGQVLYQHYRAAGEDEEGHLIEDSLLDENAHWELLEGD